MLRGSLGNVSCKEMLNVTIKRTTFNIILVLTAYNHDDDYHYAPFLISFNGSLSKF